MRRTLEMIDGRYHEVMIWVDKGYLHRRQSNSKNRISRDMQSIAGADIEKCIITGEDLKIIYVSGDTLILKNYLENAKKYLLFREKITEIQHSSKKIPIIDKRKIKAINYKRIGALTMSGCILAGSLLASSIAIPKTQATNDIPTSSLEIKIDMPEIDLETQVQTSLKKSEISGTEAMMQRMLQTDKAMILNKAIEKKQVVAEESLEERLEHVKQLQDGEMENSQLVPIAERLNDYALNRLIKFLSNEYGKYAYEYGEQFGVDPYILVAMSMQEASLRPTASSGASYGLYQINIPSPGKEWEISATNVITGEVESEIVSSQTVKNPATNTKIAAMRFQNSLRKYHNNIYMAMQSHNFGDGALSFIIDKYADKIGSTSEEVMENYADVGWIEEVKQFSYDPKGYITDEDLVKFADKHGSLMQYMKKNWPYKTYGHAKYIESVMSYYIGTTCKVSTEDQDIVMDLTTCETSEVQRTSSHELT